MAEAIRRLTHTPQPRARASHFAFDPSTRAKGATLFGSAPDILVCDATLDPSDSIALPFRTLIPPALPPSHRGRAGFSYAVVVGMQLVGQPTLLARVPVRVLPVPASMAVPPSPRAGPGQARRGEGGRRESLLLAAASSSTGTLRGDGVENPFVDALVPATGVGLPIGSILSSIESLNRRRRPAVYHIDSGRDRVVTLHLTKPTVRIGEDVIGWLDLAEGGRTRCQCVRVLLESEEGAEPADAAAPPCERRIAAEKLLVCRDMQHVALELAVPSSCVPSFTVGAVWLRWWLRFEFFVAGPPTEAADGGTGGSNGVLAWGLRLEVVGGEGGRDNRGLAGGKPVAFE